MFENRSVISIRGENKEVSIKYGASGEMAAQLAAQFSNTVPPQKNAIITDLQPRQEQTDNASDQQLLNTLKNPMISPQTNGTG